MSIFANKQQELIMEIIGRMAVIEAKTCLEEAAPPTPFFVSL
jgi:hypothetical protein